MNVGNSKSRYNFDKHCLLVYCIKILPGNIIVYIKIIKVFESNIFHYHGLPFGKHYFEIYVLNIKCENA